MAADRISQRRLADLLVDPHETLEIELKGWLDIVQNGDHKAVLAKALIALANHGGGFVIIGFENAEQGVRPAEHRPANLAGFTPDTVNAIVLAYAEPSFHCDVTIVTAPDGADYPVITVPGGHHVPIRAKRDGPNGQTVRNHSYYVRRPGPQSESPQSGQEWDGLLRRCITNARDELVDRMRDLLAGGLTPEPQEGEVEGINRWMEESLRRWEEVTAALPADNPAKFPYGHYALAYQIAGNFQPPSLNALRQALDRATIRHTGWPQFWLPTRPEIAPYPHNNNIECWIARDGEQQSAMHSDYWRASPQGKLFLVRGYQEDSAEERGVHPGTVFDITLPTWRIGEALLHAANMARELGDPEAEILFLARWTGLKGRRLESFGNSNRIMTGQYISQQDEFVASLSVKADQIEHALPELVRQLVSPLYELFDFFPLPQRLVAEELTKMRAHQF